MKRENINTIIAMSGLILAAYGNYKQFKLETDKLELTVNTGVIGSSELELNKDFSVPKALYGDNTRLAGPASIILEVSNNMSRPVTIKKIEVELIKDGAAINYSSMFNPLDKKTLDNLLSPTTIAEHTVKKIELRINIPIHYNEKFSSCFRSIKSTKLKTEKFSNVGFCYYKNGVDLLGNKVQLKQFEGGGYMVESSKGNSLNYRVTAITGDNSKMVSLATFY
ncbi:hypothetical protein SNR26_07845 [Pectobacterium brasiliense]|uniref:hypothetical protein n=1 Tax=Pectobacterium brasiliense TaxID=180957 RepID=UPI002A7EE677|nr:hypothetical protein [Pectobacterium brasiliense]MDY4367628.1 hypothetical protein [Pectobacterium brasiliense]MDY7057159.1 hypothetical protein [Pectobacterium brasiliense]